MGRSLGIALFTPNYPGVTGEGGIGTYARNLGSALTALGHRVHAVTHGSRRVSERIDGVTVHQFPRRHWRGFERFAPGVGAALEAGVRLGRLAREEGIDLIELPNWDGMGARWPIPGRVPIVCRLHTSTRQAVASQNREPTRLERWDMIRERHAMRIADALVTHSRAHLEAMREELEGIADRDSVTIIPHGVPFDASYRREESGDDGARDLRVVFLGRLEPRKGAIDLLRAAPRVLAEIPRARFTLIGNDRRTCPGGRSHEEFLREEFPAEVRSRVEFAGRLRDEEAAALVRSADVFAAPSLYESFGLIFLEAMRWGTPVVGTTAGGIPEVVDDGETGLLAPPGNPEGLAAALTRLLRDEGLRRRLGEAGRRKVEREFSLSRMGERVAAHYESVIEARARARRRGRFGFGFGSRRGV